MNVPVLQHIACDRGLAPSRTCWLNAARGFFRVELDEGKSLPRSLDCFDAIVVMGGPMSVNDAAQHSGPAPEVGVVPVYPTSAGRVDPVLGPCRWPLSTLQWHSDTFELPDGAVLLACSPAYHHQAIRVGALTYGVQFHVEVGAALADEWARVPEYVTAADNVLGTGGGERLLADVRSASPQMLEQARDLFARWIDLWSLPQLYAHRLGREPGPDSSRATLRATLAGPVGGLETDACLTADGRLVLLHDRG